MITKEQLLSAGYIDFTAAHRNENAVTGSHCVGFFEKRVRVANGNVAFAVHVSLHEFPQLGTPIQLVEFSVRLFLPRGNQVCGETGFDLKIHPDHTHSTIEAIEKMCADVYAHMGCVPMERNEEQHVAEQ